MHAQLCPTLCDPMDCSQVPLSMGFSRQEYWSGLPFPPPGDLPDLGIKPSLPNLLHCRQILYHRVTLSQIVKIPSPSLPFYFFLKNINLFLTVLSLRRCMGFYLVTVSRGYSLVPMCASSLRWLLLLWSTRSRFQNSGSTSQAQQWWPGGLEAPRHEGSSWNPRLLHWQVNSLPLSLQGCPTILLFITETFQCL